MLTGTLAGTATPAAVPASGGGSVARHGARPAPATALTRSTPSPRPAVTSAHRRPSSSTAPPHPLPVLTLTPTAVSGDTVTFAFTEAEAGGDRRVPARLGRVRPLRQPDGLHRSGRRLAHLPGPRHRRRSATSARRPPTPGPSTSPSPPSRSRFPTVAGTYSDSGFNAGCGTASTGDVCGTADDDTAVTAVAVSLRRLSTGLWWNGTAFSAGTRDLPGGHRHHRLDLRDQPDRARRGRLHAAGPGQRRRQPRLRRPHLHRRPHRAGRADPDQRAAGHDRAVGDLRVHGPPTRPPASSAGSTAARGPPARAPRPTAASRTGSHTVNVRAVDGAGNTSAATSTTWTVDATAPTAAMTFPAATDYNLAGWAAGCGTAADRGPLRDRHRHRQRARRRRREHPAGQHQQLLGRQLLRRRRARPG